MRRLALLSLAMIFITGCAQQIKLDDKYSTEYLSDLIIDVSAFDETTSLNPLSQKKVDVEICAYNEESDLERISDGRLTASQSLQTTKIPIDKDILVKLDIELSAYLLLTNKYTRCGQTIKLRSTSTEDIHVIKITPPTANSVGYVSDGQQCSFEAFKILDDERVVDPSIRYFKRSSRVATYRCAR